MGRDSFIGKPHHEKKGWKRKIVEELALKSGVKGVMHGRLVGTRQQ